jgi:hypothetical protein
MIVFDFPEPWNRFARRAALAGEWVWRGIAVMTAVSLIAWSLHG